MKILQVKKYCLLIKVELQSKSNLHILLQENLHKNKQKRLKITKKTTRCLKFLKPDSQQLKIKDGIPEDSLINCKIKLFLTWSANCFTIAGAINNKEPTFTLIQNFTFQLIMQNHYNN